MMPKCLKYKTRIWAIMLKISVEAAATEDEIYISRRAVERVMWEHFHILHGYVHRVRGER
jgi:hypothetical protein